ncbi:hypothetical protein Pint_14086 [Pistacia integerrima]|uniref:Uncharacterized protein n=1 Tax=Pistacia integerrima TaxID=434235 RepID=A0ACC0Y924_9ROSI|nr:hypothetical protein Pint_14086 [Pistacia integerrima]
MEPCQICRFKEQNCNNFLLYVHLEAVLCRVFADTTCEMSVKSRSRVTCKQRACY